LEAEGEAEALQQAHAAYYLALAEEGEAKLKTAEQAVWLTGLEQEHDNVRAALRWALGNNETEMALRLCGALWRFWTMHGHLSEGRRWAEAALSSADHTPLDQMSSSVLAKALSSAGMLAYYQANYGQATTLCGESLHLYRQL